MTQTFGTEIETLLYETLTGDVALIALLGGDGMDPRIYPSWMAQERPRISDSQPGYVVMRFDEAAQPQRVGGAVDERWERYRLSLFSLPETGELRGDVMLRFRELFHRKGFVTESYLVFDVGEVTREERLTDDRLIELAYLISCGFLPR